MKDSFKDSFKVACRSRLLVVRGCSSFAVACRSRLLVVRGCLSFAVAYRSPGLGSVDRLVVVVVVCSLDNIEKTVGFTVFSLDNVEKPLVLLHFRLKTLKNHWFWETIFAKH